MAQVLLLAEKADLHTRALVWGLERLGQNVLCLSPHAFPSRQTLSVNICNEGISHEAHDLNAHAINLSKVDVVWNRRALTPSLSDALHSEDRAFAEQQSKLHLASFAATMCPNAFWVNSLAAMGADLNKVAQLRIAANLGFKIPKTIISNDPFAIREFVKRFGKVVFKPYIGSFWRSQDGASVLVNYTSMLNEKDLTSNDSLSACPGIYQQWIDADFEIRITVIGSSIFAIKIENNARERDYADWKIDRVGAGISLYRASEDLRDGIRKYMIASGLIFGCIDLIVDKSGDIWFLECNQSGQFLWVELRVPQLPVLDAMCQLLSRSDDSLNGKLRSNIIRFADFIEKSERD